MKVPGKTFVSFYCMLAMKSCSARQLQIARQISRAVFPVFECGFVVEVLNENGYEAYGDLEIFDDIERS